MCTKYYDTKCRYEKSPIEINGLMAEIIVDNDTKEILNSLKKNDLLAIKYKSIKYLNNWLNVQLNIDQVIYKKFAFSVFYFNLI